VDDDLVAAVEGHDHELEKASMAVEPQHELLGRDVVVRLTLVRTMSDGVQDVFLADAVLEGRMVDPHAT